MPAGAICPCGRLTNRPSRRCTECEASLAEKRRLRDSVYQDPRWRTCKLYVWARDGFRCVECGHVDMMNAGKSLDADHNPLGVLELLERGLDPFNPENARTLCKRCHGRKGGRGLRR